VIQFCVVKGERIRRCCLFGGGYRSCDSDKKGYEDLWKNEVISNGEWGQSRIEG